MTSHWWALTHNVVCNGKGICQASYKKLCNPWGMPAQKLHGCSAWYLCQEFIITASITVFNMPVCISGNFNTYFRQVKVWETLCCISTHSINLGEFSCIQSVVFCDPCGMQKWLFVFQWLTCGKQLWRTSERFGKVRQGKQNKPLQSTSLPAYSQLSCVMSLGFVFAWEAARLCPQHPHTCWALSLAGFHLLPQLVWRLWCCTDVLPSGRNSAVFCYLWAPYGR